jgi:hypothetical protein
MAELLNINLREVPVAEDLDRQRLAMLLAQKGYSGADVTNVLPIFSSIPSPPSPLAHPVWCCRVACADHTRGQICRDASMMSMRRAIAGLTPAEIRQVGLRQGGPAGTVGA